MMRPVFMVLAAALALAGCEPGSGPCSSKATRELQTVDRLIAETRQAIDRGYVMADTQGNAGVNFCLGGENDNVGLAFCTNGNQRKPVAIDQAAERRKLDGLLKRKAALEAQAKADAAACAGGAA